jgi:SAM-dependent methyltransferase
VCDPVNLDYVERELARFPGARRVLDVGSLDVNGSCRPLIVARGWEYLGVDVTPGPGVDLLCDMAGEWSAVDATLGGRRFDLVLCLNVLEHVFEPIRVLDNLHRLLEPGGHLLVVTPLVWDLHQWPADYYRLNPDFFRTFAERRGLTVIEDAFQISMRDGRRFFRDTRVLPELWREIYRRSFAGLAIAALAFFVRPLRHAWPHLYVNLVLRKPAAGAAPGRIAGGAAGR